ncbi:MAG: hypothetical protein ABFS09_01875 [Thermodesulfobacteriota bacterium]
MNIKRLYSWLREVSSWALEAKLPFCCLAVLLAAFLFCFTWPSETSIRSSGYALQMIGMLFAIRGLLNIRAHFNQPTLKKLSFAWFRRFPKWGKTTDLTIEDLTCGTSISDITLAQVWTPDNPKDSQDKRIDGILKNLDRIKQKQAKYDIEIHDLHENLKNHQKEQKKEYENIEVQFKIELEAVHTNDIVTSLVGLVWLTFGITLSTMSKELLLIV